MILSSHAGLQCALVPTTFTHTCVCADGIPQKHKINSIHMNKNASLHASILSTWLLLRRQTATQCCRCCPTRCQCCWRGCSCLKAARWAPHMLPPSHAAPLTCCPPHMLPLTCCTRAACSVCRSCYSSRQSALSQQHFTLQALPLPTLCQPCRLLLAALSLAPRSELLNVRLQTAHLAHAASTTWCILLPAATPASCTMRQAK
jgi:hypothetical protein